MITGSQQNDALNVDRALVALLEKLTGRSRRQLAREIARDLRRTQVKRIEAQKNPDGTAFTRRKARFITVQQGMRFLWRGEVRNLKNWQSRKGRRGDMITGYDIERSAVRSFYKRDIDRFIEVKTARIRTKAKTRQTRMFKKLASSRYLLAQSTADGAAVYFAPQVQRIAQVHQYGLKDRIRPNVEVQYPSRQLLGFTPADMQHIEYQIISWLTKAG